MERTIPTPCPRANLWSRLIFQNCKLFLTFHVRMMTYRYTATISVIIRCNVFVSREREYCFPWPSCYDYSSTCVTLFVDHQNDLISNFLRSFATREERNIINISLDEFFFFFFLENKISKTLKKSQVIYHLSNIFKRGLNLVKSCRVERYKICLPVIRHRYVARIYFINIHQS